MQLGEYMCAARAYYIRISPLNTSRPCGSSEKHAWGANPEFDMYPNGDDRATDDLPTESCLIEVEDGDLTDGSIEHKWSRPKLKQAFMEKLRWIANKYNLVAAHPAAAKRQRRTRA